MQNKIIIGLVLFLASNFTTVSAFNQNQQNEFLQAYEVLHKGGFYDSSHLSGYILKPYLDYERIKQNLKRSSDQTLIDFIQQNPRSLLAENINSDLLVRYAKQGKWRSVLKFYREGQGGIKAKCSGLEAKIRTTNGNNLKTALNQSMQLWLSGNSRPNNCNSLFSLLRQKSLINDAKAWQRITLAMKAGKTSLSKSLAKYTNNPSLVSLWIKLRSKPAKHLQNKQLKKKNARSRQVITYGIKRLARKNTRKATQQWTKFQKSHSFTAKEKADVESYLGVKLAYNHSPYALQKLAAIPMKFRSEDASQWMARIAMRQGDWSKLLNAIYSMPAELRKKDVWQYWQAQAEKRSKKKTSVNLHKLAKNASFYGFLAADELKQHYERLLQPDRNWNQLTPKIQKIPAIQRATELFSLGMDDLAKKEWFWALKKLNKQDKLVAAAYAHKINQPFLGIVSVSKTKDWNQTGLRFPMKYQSLVQKSARKHGIIPAWVYAIMRRESAFDPVIVSSANAKGLMQILPATAKGVARKLGIKSHQTSDLFVPEKNANLGAAYLSQMLKRFKGNYVKATASYNAGPHRIPRWAPDFNIAAPRWIESIPFDETRNYVRAVMSYTTIYDHKLHHRNGRSLRLSQRLQAVGPN